MSNLNRMSSLDELTASELNAAIDDTNFPKVWTTASQNTSVDESNAQQNGKTTNQATTPLNGNEENTNEHVTDGSNSNPTPNEPLPPNVQNGIKGFIKRAHPAPLKMVAFKGDSIDVPGTPKTPRTSTTPGRLFVTVLFCKRPFFSGFSFGKSSKAFSYQLTWQC